MFGLPVAAAFLWASAVFAQPVDERQQPPTSTLGKNEGVAANPPRWVHTERRIDKLPRVTAKRILGTNGVATSFEGLQSILEPGRQVVFAQHDRSAS